jgi:hypothetical protein
MNDPGAGIVYQGFGDVVGQRFSEGARINTLEIRSQHADHFCFDSDLRSNNLRAR